MTSRPNARSNPQAGPEPEFDLIEDLGADEEASGGSDFGRALDDLLPEAGGPGVDIDLDDFEAFNRELDAQLEHARAPAGEPPVEDLGVEVVEAASRPPPEAEHDWDDTTEEPVITAEANEEEPELAEDRVTLASRPAATSAAAAPVMDRTKATVAHVRAERESGAPTGLPPAPSSASDVSAATESRGGRGGAIGMLLGLAGLAAGGAALWLTMERQAELERINATLAIRPDVVKAAPAPAAVAGTEAIQALDTRISAIRERIASLEARTVEAAQNAAPAEALDQRLAELEAEIAALQDAQRPAAVAEPTPPAPAPAITAAPTRPAEPPQPAAAVAPPVQQTDPTPLEQPTPAAEKPAPAVAPETSAAKQPPAKPAEAKAKAPPSPAPAKAASRPLPTPDAGPWVVVVQSFTSEEAAEQRRVQVAGTGLPAEVRWVNIKDQIWHRVIVPGYNSQEAARGAAAELGRRKLGSPWVLLLNRPE